MLNVPKLKQEGQGLSKKQLLDLKASEKAALAWTSANGRSPPPALPAKRASSVRQLYLLALPNARLSPRQRLLHPAPLPPLLSPQYEDPDFPCSPNSLGTELSQHVTSWRRPSEFAENPLLFKNFWEIEGVQPSPLLNDRWFLGALNIVAGNKLPVTYKPEKKKIILIDKMGNKDNVDRMFLSALKEEGAKDQMAALSEQGAREGFYIVRFYHDDPASDDDW
ncbi:hypothetical protein T492DRAFT_849379, partial [Pavlovales sp. CCMP2436]